MTTKEALNYFNQYLSQDSKKSVQKLAKEFMDLLNNLKAKNLSEAESLLIEEELGALKLNPNEVLNRRQLKGALEQFKKQLRQNFSLFTKGYYINMGVGLGSLFGLSIGVVFGQEGISMGICFGMLAGLLVGRNLEAQSKASGNLI
ncbi:MAG: hypothetical protein DA405_07960 [Bacteroidetes bacterium]|nr:MAG: hypothetical protein DA405_07960 [Bacteroidota bacterium]